MSDYYVHKDVMKAYGGEWIFSDEKGKEKVIIGPIFGKDFVNAPWNRKWAGKRVMRDSNRRDLNYQTDEWCYVNRFKGCTDFEDRNRKKLYEYLDAKNKREEDERNQGNISGGRGTRRVKKNTHRLRRTRKR